MGIYTISPVAFPTLGDDTIAASMLYISAFGSGPIEVVVIRRQDVIEMYTYSSTILGDSSPSPLEGFVCKGDERVAQSMPLWR